VSLYWCVFAGDRELDGVDAGSYAEFGALRRLVAERLEGGRAGARFPALQLHSDCDGEWSAADCVRLAAELDAVAAELGPEGAAGRFRDADGALLVDRLRELAALSRRTGQPILFQ
jgi:Immunity protein 70